MPLDNENQDLELITNEKKIQVKED